MFLGIESSCDETAVALYDPAKGYSAQIIHSQIAAHRAYGGVVPELAARDHVRYLPQLCRQIMQQEQVGLSELSAVAYTAGPGLIGALLVGASYGHSLAYALGVPAYAVNHLEAHLLIARHEYPELRLPYIALIASGGHTSLYLVRAIGDYRLLPYPGGAELEQLAQGGDSEAYRFSQPLARQQGFDFSFSGLKTQARNLIAALEQKPEADWRTNIAASFQQTVINSLLRTTIAAARAHDCRRITICGGVSANSELRRQAQQLARQNQLQIYFPSPELSADNALMVAYAAAARAAVGLPSAPEFSIQADPRWRNTLCV